MLITPWEDFNQEPESPFDEYHIPPRVIYHYTSVETAALIIAGQTLKFALPTEFNDPLDMYEGIVSFETNSRLIRQWLKRKYPRFSRKVRRDMEHLYLTNPKAQQGTREAISKIKRPFCRTAKNPRSSFGGCQDNRL